MPERVGHAAHHLFKGYGRTRVRNLALERAKGDAQLLDSSDTQPSALVAEHPSLFSDLIQL